MTKGNALATIRKNAKKKQKVNPRLSYQSALKAAGKEYRSKGTKKAALGNKKVATKTEVTVKKTTTVGTAKRTGKRKPASVDIRNATKKLQAEIGDLYGRKVVAPKKSQRNKLQKQIVEKTSLLRKLAPKKRRKKRS